MASSKLPQAVFLLAATVMTMTTTTMIIPAAAALSLPGVAKAKTMFQKAKVVVAGAVPCSTGSLIDIATSPAFPNAEVELRCAGEVVAGATTSTNGTFTMELQLTGAAAVAVEAFVGGCSLVVDTPLVKCNATLPPAGELVSHLQGPLAKLLGGVFHLFPAGFSFHPR